MSLKVLLIDDHMLFREGLISLLQRRNIEVLAAVGDGNEGIRLVQEMQPDIVLLDKRMPIIDGISVLKHLKKIGLQMPIVMLTTSSNEQDLLDALKAGASGMPRLCVNRIDVSGAEIDISRNSWPPS